MAVPGIEKVVPPALPVAPVDYVRPYVDQLNNVQRLFYNRLSQSFNTLIGNNVGGVIPGGGYLYFPFAAIQRNTDKTFTANTATLITFDQNDFLSACTNDGTDGITVQRGGIYNYQFSVQWSNTDSQAHDSWIWLRIDGVDAAGTASRFTVPSKHGTTDGHLIAAANFYIQLNPGQHVDMYAAVENSLVTMEYYAAQTTPFIMPSAPSVVATLTYVSSI